jgi:hypothetical protein
MQDQNLIQRMTNWKKVLIKGFGEQDGSWIQKQVDGIHSIQNGSINLAMSDQINPSGGFHAGGQPF